jgi:hypothetical protein
MEDSVGDGFDLKNGSFVEVFVDSVSVGNFHGNFGYNETINIVPPGYVQLHVKEFNSASFKVHFSKTNLLVLEIILSVASIFSFLIR